MPRELVLSLASELRDHVVPSLGSHAGRASRGAGAGGDVTFEIDRAAEAFVEDYLRTHAPDVAYYSEDRGLVMPAPAEPAPAELPVFAPKQKPVVFEPSELPGPANPEPPELPDFPSKENRVLLVDPIDGTRPAMAGLESCCVSIAEAILGDGRPTMGDVRVGCVHEIKTGALFVAERGRGLEIRNADGDLLEPALSANEDVSRMFWTAGFRGRPAGPLVEVLEELIDASSVGGGFFDLGSASYDLTRILTGQLDAYVDVGPLMIDELPKLREDFERVGGGAVLNNSPYDLAAAVLCLQEAGAVVTDARGEGLGERPLLGSGHAFQISCVAAANARLHSDLLFAVERGIERLRARCS
jgi:myo-inositol-1(or 4)-monophosphatase